MEVRLLANSFKKLFFSQAECNKLPDKVAGRFDGTKTIRFDPIAVSFLMLGALWLLFFCFFPVAGLSCHSTTARRYAKHAKHD